MELLLGNFLFFDRETSRVVAAEKWGYCWLAFFWLRLFVSAVLYRRRDVQGGFWQKEINGFRILYMVHACILTCLDNQRDSKGGLPLLCMSIARNSALCLADAALLQLSARIVSAICVRHPGRAPVAVWHTQGAVPSAAIYSDAPSRHTFPTRKASRVCVRRGARCEVRR